MKKETKTEAQQRLFNHYVNNCWPVLDFKSFTNSLTNEKDKKVFTENTFKSYYLKNYKPREDTKQNALILKEIKAGKYKPDEFCIKSAKNLQNEIRIGKYGHSKSDETVVANINGMFVLDKTLLDKKTEEVLMKVYKINWNTKLPGQPQYFFVSNEWGNHFRTGSIFLKQFVETAALRKKYKIV